MTSFFKKYDRDVSVMTINLDFQKNFGKHQPHTNFGSSIAFGLRVRSRGHVPTPGAWSNNNRKK